MPRALGLRDGQAVLARNEQGEVSFQLSLTAEGAAGGGGGRRCLVDPLRPRRARTVNALTSQRLTDLGEGSTFYDNRVEVVPA